MDWFERLTGFRETGYAETRARLAIEGDRLHSRVNGMTHGVGTFEAVSLQELRDRARAAVARPGRVRARVVTGDIRAMHRRREYAGALFQVASQFNMLEMPGPHVTPEHGVTGYDHDRTQGPACAIAAGAATIFRNYFVPVGDGEGQTADRQLDGLADLGALLSRGTELPIRELWTMSNGYALASRRGLDAIAGHLAALAPGDVDALRGALRIGVHRDVEATEADGPERPRVSQAFCSALPVAYSGVEAAQWEAFARLVLEAAYEATLWEAVLNARRGRSDVVLLTLLGGGAFGNPAPWIDGAIRRSLAAVAGCGLDVVLVSFGPPSRELEALAAAFG